METASPCDVFFSFFFFSLFIWNARVTVGPIVYLAPLSHPFPGNPKHRKPAFYIGPKGDSRQHRALGTPTKESLAQHRQHIQFLWFSSSSSFNKKKNFFLSGAWLQLLFFGKELKMMEQLSTHANFLSPSLSRSPSSFFS